MKNIILRELNNEKYDYLVFSTTIDSPLFYVNKILKKIKNDKTITIVFDQLLQTGNNDNRFISFQINNNSLQFSTAEIISNNLEPLKKVISKFLHDNQDIMEYSILLSEQKEIIRNGGII